MSHVKPEPVPLALFLLACSMILASFSIVIFTQFSNREIGKISQFYNRATNCFAATSPTKRTTQYVRECYDKAEKATGIKGERYGDGL